MALSLHSWATEAAKVSPWARCCYTLGESQTSRPSGPELQTPLGRWVPAPASRGSTDIPEDPTVKARGHVLDPGLLVIHVPEELVQAMGFIQLGSPGGCHALDLLETTVDGVPLVLYLGGVEGTAGHQAVCLAVQVLQAILGRGTQREG